MSDLSKLMPSSMHSNLHDLYDYAAVQINDTHPSMVIPELIRLLCAKGIAFEEAGQLTFF